MHMMMLLIAAVGRFTSLLLFLAPHRRRTAAESLTGNGIAMKRPRRANRCYAQSGG